MSRKDLVYISPESLFTAKHGEKDLELYIVCEFGGFENVLRDVGICAIHT